MLEYSAYLLYRAGVYVLSLLPFPALFAFGQLAGTVAWLLLPGYRRLAWNNLRLAYGDELTTAAASRLVRKHFQRLGANLLCSIKFSQTPITGILRRVEVTNFDAIKTSLTDSKPLILLLSHVGAWELCAQLLPNFIPNTRKSTVYQRLGNRYIDRHVREARSRFGIELFERSGGFGKALQLLKEGGAIGILSDQHAGDSGVWTPFFGRLASTTPLPALLARRTGARIVALAVHTVGFARWRAIAEAPLDPGRESTESLTLRGNELIEQQVRRAPEDWLWLHNRWKTPMPNFLLPRYKRGIFVPENAVLKPFRILVRSSNWLGDAVMSIPSVRALKTGRPDAHVTVATPEKLAAIWKIVPDVDEVLALPTKSIYRTVRQYRKAPRFDAAIVFPNSLRSALEVALAGIPRRVGFAGHTRKWLLNQQPRRAGRRHLRRGVVHQTYKYLRLPSAAGANVRPEFAAAQPISRQSISLKFGMCPGAEYGPAKRWLPERFIEVGQQIAKQFQVEWVLFGTPADMPICRYIAAHLEGKCLNRAGRTSLEELIKELAECALLLTNDTGSMHLAAFLRVPTVSIFGSTEPRLTGPLGAGHRIFHHHVECSPCFLRSCPLDFRCMHSINSSEVIQAIRQMLVRGPVVASRA